MGSALQQGAGHVISFIALFGMLNSVGSLGGTALLGTYQVIRLLPTEGDDCQYRFKSSTEAFERVAKESQLALS